MLFGTIQREVRAKGTTCIAAVGMTREILALNMHPMQKAVSAEELYKAAERALVTVTCQVSCPAFALQPSTFRALSPSHCVMPCSEMCAARVVAIQVYSKPSTPWY